jgi:hypothetical protein
VHPPPIGPLPPLPSLTHARLPTGRNAPMPGVNTTGAEKFMQVNSPTGYFTQYVMAQQAT